MSNGDLSLDFDTLFGEEQNYLLALESAVTLSPRFRKAWLEGNALAREGRQEEALEFLNMALGYLPMDNPISRVQWQFRVQYIRAWVFAQLKRFEAALMETQTFVTQFVHEILDEDDAAQDTTSVSSTTPQFAFSHEFYDLTPSELESCLRLRGACAIHTHNYRTAENSWQAAAQLAKGTKRADWYEKGLETCEAALGKRSPRMSEVSSILPTEKTGETKRKASRNETALLLAKESGTPSPASKRRRPQLLDSPLVTASVRQESTTLLSRRRSSPRRQSYQEADKNGTQESTPRAVRQKKKAVRTMDSLTTSPHHHALDETSSEQPSSVSRKFRSRTTPSRKIAAAQQVEEQSTEASIENSFQSTTPTTKITPKATPSTDSPSRRSSRHRVRPVAFWRNERGVYRAKKKGEPPVLVSYDTTD